MNYASFWRRIFAGIIDSVIYVPFEILRVKYASQNTYILILAYILIGAYFVFFWMRYSATVGMMLLQIQLVVKEGARINFGRAIIRYIGLYISAYTILGGLWMLWDKNKQMWHDKLAGTYVIRVPKTR